MPRFSKGWIKVHRDIIHAFKNDWQTMGLFVGMLMMANWEDGREKLKKQKIKLKRGQFCTSIRELQLRSGLHKTTVERALKRLTVWDTISTEAGHLGTIVTINNYDKYQCLENDVETRAGQELDTTVDTTVDTGVDTGVDYSEERKKERIKKREGAKKSLIKTWPAEHLYAKVFTNLNRIDAYREIFDFPEDEKTIFRHIERYSLSASELEQISYELAEWSNHPKNKMTSPRGKLNTFCKTVADRRKKNIGPTYNQLTLEEY